MQSVNFSADSVTQTVVNNVHLIKQAILSAYEPVSFEESSLLVQISPYANPAYGVILKLTNNNTQARFQMSLNRTKGALGDVYGELLDLCLLGGEEGKNAREELAQTIKEHYGAPANVKFAAVQACIDVDISELTIDVLACIEKLLRVSCLKPRPLNARNVQFA